ncbi:hypothetical protein HYALB_00003786 [Hymenoscyphus albidus]|uniref:HPP transmembrane region domain-containing protein n=1 Tax=Hymenoscyphus albidus TaxID=595503 RepID=A0A9N9LW36_9HELO|nr:hypothetical protein HYALB_00003786 [Hymenoscyphus albidus]
MSSRPSFNFDVDDYVNRIIPRSRLHLLPKSLSRFLGYRAEPQQQVGSIFVWFWAFIGAFLGILIIETVFRAEFLASHGAPVIVASFGAAAILEYHTIDSPLAQPRNAILGQFFAAVFGVGVTKLFQLNSNFESLRWMAGALAVGLSSAFMGFTKTVHPPAGATALLTSTSPEITRLSWFLIPLILLGSTLMVSVACILNNIQRQFPLYWWTPLSLLPIPAAISSSENPDNHLKTLELNADPEKVDYLNGWRGGENPGNGGDDDGGASASGSGSGSGSGKGNVNGGYVGYGVWVTSEGIRIPDYMLLSGDEKRVLEGLRERLALGSFSASTSGKNPGSGV